MVIVQPKHIRYGLALETAASEFVGLQEKNLINLDEVPIIFTLKTVLLPIFPSSTSEHVD
jgi:hypothetical protein